MLSQRRRQLYKRALGCSAAVIAYFIVPSARADDPPPSYTTMGHVGLVEMPSARVAPDGNLAVSATIFENTKRLNFDFQLLPWLETSFHYAALDKFNAGADSYYDRSIGLKARLWNETENIPSIAIGINDLVGTGLYSGEYVVATKRFGAVDASMGIGWGRLGDTALFGNPLAQLSTSFAGRKPLNQSGSFDFNTLFHGAKSSLFGGVVWHTPVDGLSLAAEYSSDRYVTERLSGNFAPRNQFNFGASYLLFDHASVGLEWLYGRSIGISLSLQTDPTKPQGPDKLGLPISQVTVRTHEQQMLALNVLINPDYEDQMRMKAQSARAIRNRFVDSVLAQGGDLRDISIKGRTLAIPVNAPDAAAHCADYAAMATSLGGSIDRISVSGGKGKAVVCNVPTPTAEQAPCSGSPIRW